MAALDFPFPPTTDQKYPQPPVPGQPVYTWDGEKWTTRGGAVGSTGASDEVPLPDTPTGGSGSSTLWSRGDHQHPINFTSVVRYDSAQSLTFAEQQQARRNIYAAPLDALAYNGMQINGGMDVNQSSFAEGIEIIGGSGYVCDGWALTNTTSARIYSSRGNSSIFRGFGNYIYVQPTSALATLAAGDVVVLTQPIEGFRIARLAWGTPNAQPITIAFWARCYSAGLYSGSIRNRTTNRSYVFTYTINASNTAEYKTVTLPGDASGVWEMYNETGLVLAFTVASGATYTAPAAGLWYSGNYLAAPGQINAITTTSDRVEITGVVIIPGAEAPNAGRSSFIMRPFDQEQTICQRYFQHLENCWVGISSTPHTLMFPVPMRATPIVSSGSPGFVVGNSNYALLVPYQTTAGYTNINLDARL